MFGEDFGLTYDKTLEVFRVLGLFRVCVLQNTVRGLGVFRACVLRKTASRYRGYSLYFKYFVVVYCGYSTYWADFRPLVLRVLGVL